MIYSYKNLTIVMSLAFTIFLKDVNVSRSAEVLTVCAGGDISLTCTINATIVEWSVTAPHRHSLTRLLSINTRTTVRETIPVSGIVVFEIIKVSNRGDLPLVSKLSANNVSAGVNGTLIKCREESHESLNTSMGMETIVNIILDHMIHPPNVSLTYRAEDVDVHNNIYYTLIASVVQLQDNLIYNVLASPQPPAIDTIDNSTFHLTLSYGIVYSVVITATSTLCSNANADTVLHWISVDYDSRSMDLEVSEGDSNAASLNTGIIVAAAMVPWVVTIVVTTTVLLFIIGILLYRRRKQLVCGITPHPPSTGHVKPLYVNTVQPKESGGQSIQLEENVAYAPLSFNNSRLTS